MGLSLSDMFTTYDQYFEEHSDHRSDHFPLGGSPLPPFLIVVVYLWFVNYGGPKFMENRRPYNLDTIIKIYNIFQVAICGYLSIHGFYSLYGPGGQYNWFCDEINYGTDEYTLHHLRNFYFYYLLKIVDLLDTVFFILRKKNKQVTFLHVYHHALMVMVIYYGLKFIPGGHVAFVAIINSFVHSVMYFYYFLSNWNSKYKTSLWWKKYITILQIAQFLIIIVHNLQMFAQPNCNFPKLPVLILMPQNILILFMFCDFYWKTYIKTGETKKNIKMR